MNLTHLMYLMVAVLKSRYDTADEIDLYTSAQVAHCFRAAPTIRQWTKWRRIKWFRREIRKMRRESRLQHYQRDTIRNLLNRLP